MRVNAALVKEQGLTFAIVSVKHSVLSSTTERTRTQTGLQTYWPSVPIVLMAQDSRGEPEYFGRNDIVRFLAGVPIEALPWRFWDLN